MPRISLTFSSANATLNDDGASASLTIGGTLALSAGTINVATNSVASGSLTVNSALDLSGGALNINKGGQLSLGGTLSETSGTLTLNGGAITGAGTVELSGGALDATANSTIASSFGWTGGTIDRFGDADGDGRGDLQRRLRRSGGGGGDAFAGRRDDGHRRLGRLHRARWRLCAGEQGHVQCDERRGFLSRRKLQWNDRRGRHDPKQFGRNVRLPDRIRHLQRRRHECVRERGHAGADDHHGND